MSTTKLHTVVLCSSSSSAVDRTSGECAVRLVQTLTVSECGLQFVIASYQSLQWSRQQTTGGTYRVTDVPGLL